MLYEILASVTHNPHYLTKYITFITSCQKKNETYKGYTERHHICPKAQDMFPEFASFSEFRWNCIKLTPRQHYIAHLLLYKCYPETPSQQQALYLMCNTSGKKLNSKLYNNIRLQVVKARKDKVFVKDSKGVILEISNTDPRYLSGELLNINKGKIIVRDANGNTLRVDNTDPRYLSGALIHINKGKVTVSNAYGNILRVDNTDPRYLSGELVHANKGKVTVYDSNNNSYRVDKNDSRILSGELVNNLKGLIAKNRIFTDEQVREIRLAFKDPTSIITDEYLSTVVKASQQDKVASIPFEKLKYKNGSYLNYKTLLASYYSDKFGLSKVNIINILDNKTYKEISV